MNPTDGLQQEATAVLERVRMTFGDLVAAVPGGVRKAADLHKALRIDQPLGWSVYRTVTASEPLSAGVYVPRPAASDKFFKAARKHGLPEPLIASAEDAYKAFSQLVREHAGDDPQVFETMLVNMTGERTETSELKHRRAAFRSLVHLKGIFADSYLAWVIYAPGTEPGTVHAASIRGYLNMRSLDPAKGLALDQGYSLYKPDQVTGLTPGNVRLIGESAREGGSIGFLRPFCSDPLPKVNVSEWGKGETTLTLELPDIGSKAASTWFTGVVFENVRLPMPPQTLVTFTSPVERAFVYKFVHRSLCPSAPLTAAIYLSHMIAGGRPIFREAERLGPAPEVLRLPSRVSSLSQPQIPGHADMIEYVFKNAGFALEEFEVFQVQIEFPVLFSALQLHFSHVRA